MPKNTSYIRLVDVSPTHDDGYHHAGDTFTFDSSEGVISIACTNEEGTVLLGGGLIRGDFTWSSGMSQNWEANPVPLSCKAQLLEVRKGRVVNLASTAFDIRP